MELLESKKLKLPDVYFVSDRKKIEEIPVGVPFIYGSEAVKSNLIRLLEFEILFDTAKKSGYPFNFKKILEDLGYKNLKSFCEKETVYLDKLDRKEDESYEFPERKKVTATNNLFNEFIKDYSVYVDITVLKDLKVFPVWLSVIEDAVSENIHNFAIYNNNMYNKKLEGMYGGVYLVSPPRNLIIIDISGSIPRGVSSTCLTLAQNFAHSYYADLMITGGKTTLYPYENIHELDVESIYEENGMNNDQYYYKKLITSDERKYSTVIAFGDNDNPGSTWGHTEDKYISLAEGKELCKWKVDKVISFHTRGTTNIAAYAEWFTPKEVERVADWVKYLI